MLRTLRLGMEVACGDRLAIYHPCVGRCYTCISCISRGECCAMPFRVARDGDLSLFGTDEIRTRSTHLPKSSSHDVRFHLSAIDWRTFFGSFFLLVRLISSLLRIPMTSRYCRCYCVLLIPSFFLTFFLYFTHSTHARNPWV